MSEKLGPPSLVWSFTEGTRMSLEVVAYMLARKALARRTLASPVKNGHGKPVLLWPGFGGADYTSLVLRGFLDQKGYETSGGGAGTNIGPNKKDLTQLKNGLFELYERSGGQKVSLVTHSLAGIYGCEAGRCFPDKVEQVIMLNSPIGAGLEPNSSAPFVREIFQWLNEDNSQLLGNPEWAKQMITPPPVPVTALYTRGDGVVNWRTCLTPRSNTTENIEIIGSHCGMIMNPVAFLVIADRLAQNLSGGNKDWEPFIESRYSSLLFRKDQAHYGHEPKLEKPSPTILRLFP